MRLCSPKVSPKPRALIASTTRSSPAARKPATCSTGPKISRSTAPIPSTAITVGGTNRPPPGAASVFSTAPRAAAAATYRPIPSSASASITGPTSVAASQGSPSLSASMAPSSISSTRSRASSCT